MGGKKGWIHELERSIRKGIMTGGVGRYDRWVSKKERTMITAQKTYGRKRVSSGEERGWRHKLRRNIRKGMKTGDMTGRSGKGKGRT